MKRVLRLKDWFRLAFAAVVIPAFWLGVALATTNETVAAFSTSVFAVWLLTRRQYQFARWVILGGDPPRRVTFSGYWEG